MPLFAINGASSATSKYGALHIERVHAIKRFFRHFMRWFEWEDTRIVDPSTFMPIYAVAGNSVLSFCDEWFEQIGIA